MVKFTLFLGVVYTTIVEHQQEILKNIQAYKLTEELADNLFAEVVAQLAILEHEHGQTNVSKELEEQLRQNDKLSGLIY